MQNKEVKWHSEASDLGLSQRELPGPRKQSAMFLKLADPEDAEGEHFEAYEEHLARLRALPS